MPPQTAKIEVGVREHHQRAVAAELERHRSPQVPWEFDLESGAPGFVNKRVDDLVGERDPEQHVVTVGRQISSPRCSPRRRRISTRCGCADKLR
jgi:hypothetical protein